MTPTSRPYPPFLGLEGGDGAIAVEVVPLPYEGTVSWGRGAAGGPRALLEASCQVELYDELLDRQVTDQLSLHTAPRPAMPDDPAAAAEVAEALVRAAVSRGAWPIAIGGEHSLSLGVYRALAAHHGEIGVIQLDAHADLREEYEGQRFSHACVMARVRELTDHVVQLGVRSLSRDEARRARRRRHALATIHALRDGRFDLHAALDRLPAEVFVTLDVDALDIALVRSTGTPEPGGFDWREIQQLLATIFARKRVVGVDVMELCGGDPPSAFCVARLLHRMVGLRFAPEVSP